MNRSFPVLAAVLSFFVLAGCAGSEAAPTPERGYGYEYGRDHVDALQQDPAAFPATRPDGRLSPERLQVVIRGSYPSLRACRAALASPDAPNEVVVRFEIAEEGNVVRAPSVSPSDPGGCIAKAFGGLVLPATGAGLVTVEYPLSLTPRTPPGR